MAILWYDFSESSNGSGTYASPYNGANTNFSSLGSGDEVRVKSYSIASLTDFTFTGSYSISSSTYSSPYIDVSDASLFTVGDIIMVDSDKTCFRISSLDTSSTPNKIKMHTNYERWPATMVWSMTDATFRRIDPAYYPSDTDKYIGGSGQPSGAITVSDGWYSETARVSDQSYMTIIGKTQTGSGTAYFRCNYIGDNSTLNLENTCLVAAKDSSGMSFRTEYGSDGLTATLHQLWGGLYYGIWPYGANGQTITLKYLSTYYGVSGSGGIYGDNHFVTVRNWRTSQTYYDNRGGGSNITLKVQNLHSNSHGGTIWDYSYKDGTYIYDGAMEGGQGSSPSNFQFNGTAEFTSNFSFSNNNFTSDPATQVYTTLPLVISKQWINKENVMETVSGVTNNASNLTFTEDKSFNAKVESDKEWADRTINKVNVRDFSYIYDSSEVSFGGSSPKLASAYFRDMNVSNSEYELLGSSTTTDSNGIKITKDTSVYKTTSPALKCYLPTFSSSYSDMEFVKAIDIPVDGNNSTEFTVTGWVKSDSGMFATNKLKARVAYDDTAAVTENINITNAEAGWVQFSLAFTPNDKQIAQFQLRMHPQAGAKAVWLSDVVVT